MILSLWVYEWILKSLRKKLPSKEKFYSSLTDRKISDKEYEHVLNVWKKFEMKTMKDYYDLYLKCDVLLLCDLLEIFKNDSLKNYRSYPSHYLSAPGLIWDAMPKRQRLILNLFQILTVIYSLRRVKDVEFLIFLIDIAKPTIII